MNSIFSSGNLTSEVEIFALVTVLSLLPVLVITLTTFVRNIVVLSFLRHALGLQQSPPNLILIVLALTITVFSMFPVLKSSYDQGVSQYVAGDQGFEESVQSAWSPFKVFLISQTEEKDIIFFYDAAEKSVPADVGMVEPQYLIPAFLLSELKLAFKIGFVIFLPFLLLDLVVAAMLTSLGMIMVPPITISLPLKIMLFVVIDGWSLITQVLLTSVSS